MEALRGQNTNLSAQHGTLTQSSAHPKVPVCLPISDKNNLNINHEMRFVISASLSKTLDSNRQGLISSTLQSKVSNKYYLKSKSIARSIEEIC